MKSFVIIIALFLVGCQDFVSERNGSAIKSDDDMEGDILKLEDSRFLFIEGVSESDKEKYFAYPDYDITDLSYERAFWMTDVERNFLPKMSEGDRVAVTLTEDAAIDTSDPARTEDISDVELLENGEREVFYEGEITDFQKTDVRKVTVSDSGSSAHTADEFVFWIMDDTSIMSQKEEVIPYNDIQKGDRIKVWLKRVNGAAEIMESIPPQAKASKVTVLPSGK